VSSFDPNTATLVEAKQWLRARFEEGEHCPCCNQHVKLYKRKLNSFMALSLIRMYRYFEENPTVPWVHIKDLSLKVAAGGGELAKLKFWNVIIDKEGLRDDGSDRVGFYRITELGRQFVQGGCKVPKYQYLYNQKIVRSPDGPNISIQDALGDKFNYDQLMAGG
jgi:hypothetical protein